MAESRTAALKLQFQLDDEHLEALKEELLYAHHPVADEAGASLLEVWDHHTVHQEAETERQTGQAVRLPE